MANHGCCRNCWWYLPKTYGGYSFSNGKLVETIGIGLCYMQNGDGTNYVETKETSYCRDYANREKTNKEFKKTLEEWIEEWKKT